MWIQLSLSIGLFLGSLALGWWLRRQGFLTEDRANRLVRLLVKFTTPVTSCLSFWQMELRRIEPWILPLIGLVIAFSTLLPSFLYSRTAKLTRPQTGSFLTCAFFSNLGYLGAFSAFALYGESAYGLSILYLTFFTPCFYTLGFWIAAHYGRDGIPSRVDSTAESELRLYPFVGMALGILLSFARLPRPPILEWVNAGLIPSGTALYLMAIGSQLTLTRPGKWWQACWAMSAIKFLYTPAIAWILVSLLHVQGLPRQVILLQASTPVAVSPLILPALFGIDRKLSNALWLFTTLLALPWFIVILPHLSSW